MRVAPQPPAWSGACRAPSVARSVVGAPTARASSRTPPRPPRGPPGGGHRGGERVDEADPEAEPVHFLRGCHPPRVASDDLLVCAGPTAEVAHHCLPRASLVSCSSCRRQQRPRPSAIARGSERQRARGRRVTAACAVTDRAVSDVGCQAAVALPCPPAHPSPHPRQTTHQRERTVRATSGARSQ